MRPLSAGTAAALALLAGVSALVTAAPARAATNQPPVVVDDAVTYGLAGVDYLVPALANDTDPDGDTLTYTAVTPATKGNAHLQAGKLYYTPFLFQTGTDTFTYTVSDGQGNSATGTVTVTLWVIPPAPADAAISIPAPGSATITWSAASYADQYRVYRNGVLVQTTTGLTWTDTGLRDDNNYTYDITGVNGGGFEGRPTAYLLRYAQRPAPTDLAVDVTGDPTSLSLTWVSSWVGYPMLVYRDGVQVATTTQPTFQDTGLVTGHQYSYQVQVAGSPGPSVTVFPPSPLSTAALGTPVVLSPINQVFWNLGWKTGTLGPVTVAERAVPGGRQQDHRSGIILQQDGEDAHALLGYFATKYLATGGVSGDLGFPLADWDCNLPYNGCGQQFEGGSIWSSGYTGTWVVPQEMEEGWATSGGVDGPLGYPVWDELSLGDGLVQAFEDGAVYWTPDTGSHGVSSWIWGRWAATGYEDGSLGYPTSDEVDSGSGARQVFQGGAIWWSQSGGARVVKGTLADAWNRSGWEGGSLGYPVSEEIPLRGGRGQVFSGGAVYWSPATGAHAVTGAIRTAWGTRGYENGVLGYPTSDAVASTSGVRQSFQGGTVWSDSNGARVVSGALADAWKRSGWEGGSLGYPLGNQVALRGGVGQVFSGGAVYWSPATGAHAVSGAIRTAWGAAGYENGSLGYPTSDELTLRGGTGQVFQGGAIWSSPSGGAHLVAGVMRDAWGRSGAENGALGYPTSDRVALRGGAGQVFSGGAVYWSPATGAHAVRSAIRGAWGTTGYENGPLGYPTSDEIPLRGGTGQLFQGGAIWWSQSGGAHLVAGVMRDAWGRTGAENGPLGFPTADQVSLGTGLAQTFSGGAIYWSPSTGAHAVAAAIRTAWGSTGYEGGPLGYPTSDEIALRGGSGQIFQGGTIYRSQAGGAHAVGGAIRTAWSTTGYENGRLGYPTSDETVTAGTHTQTFQGGTITVDSSGQRSISYS